MVPCCGPVRYGSRTVGLVQSVPTAKPFLAMVWEEDGFFNFCDFFFMPPNRIED